MIHQLTFALIASGVVLFALFAFIDCIIDYPDCKHETCATFDSCHKKMCIDCGKEFSTREIKK
jgi:hypothetical protein